MCSVKRLKIDIRRAGYTQIQIANQVGIKPPTLASYLNGYTPMPDEVREAIENILEEDEK